MKKLTFLLLIFFTTNALSAYDRNVIAQLLQEQAYVELLSVAAKVPISEQDAYLLSSAGFAAYQNNMLVTSESYYKNALRADSQSTQSLLYLGLISRQRKDYAVAVNYFNQLVALKPNNGRAYKYAADCYTSMAKPDSSLQLMSTAYRMSPNDPTIVAGYSELLLEKKRYAEADNALEKYVMGDGRNAPVIELMIKSNYQQNKYKTVLFLAQRLQETGEVNYVPYYYTMAAALQLKAYEQCLTASKLLMKMGYESEQVLYYAAKAQTGLKNYAAANELLQRCIEAGISENIEAYYTELGDNLSEMKKFHLAQKNYDTARYHSGNPDLLYRKGLAYDAAKQDAQAKMAYAGYLKNAKKGDSAMINYAKKRVGK